MKRILLISGAVLGVLLLAALIVPFLVPASVYKAEIEQAATASLQREVTLSGDARLSVLPRIAVSVKGVRVANAPGFAGDTLIEAGELRGSVKWLPLLSRRVEIEELAFVDANVNLQKNADGTVNWDLGAFAARPENADKADVDAAIGKAVLRNANLRFTDAATGKTFALTKLNAQAAMDALDKPVKLKGQGLFQGEQFDVRLTFDSPGAISNKAPATAALAVRSTLGDLTYDGTLTLTEAMALDGAFTAKSDTLAALAKFAGVTPGMDLARLGKLEATGRVSGPVETLKISFSAATQTSDLLKTGFTGDITLGATPQIGGKLSLAADSAAELATFANVELPMKIDALGRVDLSAGVNGALTEPALDFETLVLKGPLVRANYAGKVILGKTPELDGTFKANISKAGALATALDIELAAPDLFEKVDASGRIRGPADALTLSELSAVHTGTQLSANYSGAVTLGKKLVLDGKVVASLPQAGDFARAMKIEVPAPDAIERVEFSATMKGPLDTLQLANLDLKHAGALINAAYKGTMQLGGDGALNGNFNASSDAMRGLLGAAGVDMAPGSSLQRFAARGAISGSFKTLAFNGLDLTLDQVRAKGNAGLDLKNTRPRLTGKLDMGTLDLTPFLGETDPAKPKSGLTAWSKDPLDLAALKSVDADLRLTTTTLKIGKVELTSAAIVTQLSNGRLVADLPTFKAFDGDWSGDVLIDTAGAVPTAAFNMQGKSVAMSGLLGTLANFSRLDGQGGFKVSARGSGASIDAIMRDLDGQISTNLAEGTLRGFNVAEAVRSAASLRQAVATGNLRNLNFSGVLSPTAATDFSSFNAVLKIEKGVAKIDVMKLLSPVLGMDGTGKIDIGGQTLDVRLATGIDKKAGGSSAVLQLNGIPVPVRLSGNWAGLKVTPDLSGIESALKDDIGGRVRDGITGRLGSSGGLIGDVIGLPVRKPAVTPAPSPEETIPAPAQPAPAPTRTLEDQGTKIARDTIDGLLGRKKKPAPSPAPPPEPAPSVAPPAEPAPEPVPPAPSE
jgi:AsmA protein